jgi:very-short-patch-repair endonuclease
MRSDPRPPENTLWSFLRAHRFGGLKFRRQDPIGPFIVDFFCAETGVGGRIGW